MGRIDTELHIIQNNRYGEDVRMAIHDALDKLEKTSGGGANANPFKLIKMKDVLIGTVGTLTPVEEV